MGCYFKNEGNRLTLGNECIKRTWSCSDSGIYTVSLSDEVSGRQWVGNKNRMPEFYYEGLTCSIRNPKQPYKFKIADISVNEVTGPLNSGPFLEVVFSFINELYGIEVKRHAILYEGTAAIRTYIEVKSHNLPMGDFFAGTRFNVLDSIPVALQQGCVKSYEFFTRTDTTNDLVHENINLKGFDKSSILFYAEPDGTGLFLLKESPCFSDQRPECEGNFFIEDDGISTLGWGIRPEEVGSDGFRASYGSVVGVYNGGSANRVVSLKNYQRARAAVKPERDFMVMANPWGDRSCLEHMGEAFVLKELEACSRLGATHYQLDDGWEKGERLEHIVYNEKLGDDFWEISKERFPDGFQKIQKEAERLNIQLGLWFAPDANRLYRDWRRQADILYKVYREYGIRIFKIDAVKIRNREAEENLEMLLKTLQEKSKGEITFNLDTTADPRPGYFMFTEYGNIFLENRYTDWKNYYPWLTLKNLWDLCLFVPPQKLQIEFLNTARNRDKYDEADALAPGNYSYEYIFSIAMMANPLCWFEPSSLEEDALLRYRRMIDLHRKYRLEIFDGYILPVGERPSGYSWTGFQSHNPGRNCGFLILYREWNERDRFALRPEFLENRNVRFCSLSDDTSDVTVSNYDGSGIEFCLDDINSFRLYKYEYK